MSDIYIEMQTNKRHIIGNDIGCIQFVSISISYFTEYSIYCCLVLIVFLV